MKKHTWIFFPLFLVFLGIKSFDWEIQSWRISKHLESGTKIVKGELIGHEYISLTKGRHRPISIVEFFIENKRFHAEMDRLKVKPGIELDVIYNIESPKWHRVIVPDTLKKYHMQNAFYGEHRFYTWPPSEPDGKRVAKRDSAFRKGPY
jgi:hypothetical protein